MDESSNANRCFARADIFLQDHRVYGLTAHAEKWLMHLGALISKELIKGGSVPSQRDGKLPGRVLRFGARLETLTATDEMLPLRICVAHEDAQSTVQPFII